LGLRVLKGHRVHKDWLGLTELTARPALMDKTVRSVRLDRQGRPEPLGQPDQLARRGQQDQRALMAQMALTVSLT
jgi:hypothetical protein